MLGSLNNDLYLTLFSPLFFPPCAVSFPSLPPTVRRALLVPWAPLTARWACLPPRASYHQPLVLWPVTLACSSPAVPPLASITAPLTSSRLLGEPPSITTLTILTLASHLPRWNWPRLCWSCPGATPLPLPRVWDTTPPLPSPLPVKGRVCRAEVAVAARRSCPAPVLENMRGTTLATGVEGELVAYL